jgi:uncharacterized protein YjiS (DUF1127 family)
MRFANQMSTPAVLARETARIPRSSFAVYGAASAGRSEPMKPWRASSPAIRRPVIEHDHADLDVPFRAASGSSASRRSIAAALSWLVSLVLDGFAEYGEAMYPCFDDSAATARREADDARLSGAVVSASYDAESRSAFRFPKLWSAIRRKRECSRISAAWEVLDERTLRDIGISRYEIECFGRPEPAWRQDDPRR